MIVITNGTSPFSRFVVQHLLKHVPAGEIAVTTAEIDALEAAVASGSTHPKEAKVALARHVVTEFHDARAADEAVAEFDRVHARRELPADLRDVRIDFGSETSRALTRVMVDAGLATSASDASRRIQQGGVKLDGLPRVLQTGRHAVRLTR